MVPVLALLVALGPFSIDMYLPAFPAMRDALATIEARVQLTLSVFMLVMACGQMLFGALSDRVGRRPVFLAGLALFVLASLGCSQAGGVGALILLRALQALGGCAAVVVGYAVVRDLWRPAEAAAILSWLALVMFVAPLVAPLVGGWVLLGFAWRGVFWTLAGIGLLAFAYAALTLKESLPEERRAVARRESVLDALGGLLRDRATLGSILCGGFGFAGMFAYIAGTPYVYIEAFGVSPRAYGLLFGLNILGMMAWAGVNGRAVRRFGWSRLLGLAAAIALASAIGLFIMTATRSGGLVGLVVGLFFYVGVMGLFAPNSMTGAMARFPARAGAASALTGAFRFGLGALSGYLVGVLHDGTALPMAGVILASGVLSALTWVLLVRPGVRAAAEP